MRVLDAVELFLQEQPEVAGRPHPVPAVEILRLIDFAKWCDEQGIKIGGNRKVSQVIGKVDKGATVVGMKL